MHQKEKSQIKYCYIKKLIDKPSLNRILQSFS